MSFEIKHISLIDAYFVAVEMWAHVPNNELVTAVSLFLLQVLIMSLCTGALYRFTGLFDLSFSRYLDGNQLTELPEGLLNATTQLLML